LWSVTTTVVCRCAARSHVDALLAELAGTDGEATRRSLSDEQTTALESELKPTPTASSGPSQRGAASAGRDPVAHLRQHQQFRTATRSRL
jgi:hypothetical protein